jgi:hypothetical protein
VCGAVAVAVAVARVMAAPRRAAPLAALLLSGGGAAAAGLLKAESASVAPPQPLVFFATADWGGEQAAPFTTPGQLAVAAAMGTLAAEAGSHPSFMLAAGDNFYMDGLPGASRAPPGKAVQCAMARAGKLTCALRPCARQRSAAAERDDRGARGGHVPGGVHRAWAAGALVFRGWQPRLGG